MTGHSASAHTIGYLGRLQAAGVITEVMNVGGIEVHALVDTGATATFAPLKGKVIKHLCPKLTATQVTVSTANNQINSSIYHAIVMMKPRQLDDHPQPCEVLVFDTNQDHILGPHIRFTSTQTLQSYDQLL